jgi:hypothetical protein
MKHEHAMCRANDIEQKHLLGGNPTQKEKKIRFAFFFLYLLFFCILLYFGHSLIFLFFFSTLRIMLCLKCGGIERILIFFFCVKKKHLCLIFLNSYWFIRIRVLFMRIN